MIRVNQIVPFEKQTKSISQQDTTLSMHTGNTKTLLISHMYISVLFLLCESNFFLDFPILPSLKGIRNGFAWRECERQKEKERERAGARETGNNEL